MPWTATASTGTGGAAAGRPPTARAGTRRPRGRRFDDGWDIEEELPPFRTEVSDRAAAERDHAATHSPDIHFDRSINPYRGCEHGCIYCFARPTHAYLGLSPGLDFETRLVARPGLPEVLRRELARKGYKVRPIALGTNTDPYQPVEKSCG